MTTIFGLPAHALLVHAIVVLAPLTAVLEILCGLWPAARRSLVWLVLALAAVTTVLTPLTTSAGEWLIDQRSQIGPVLQEHAERGDLMIYFSVALLVVAVGLAVLNWRAARSEAPMRAATAAVAVLALVVGISSTVLVVSIGHLGAESVWGDGG